MHIYALYNLHKYTPYAIRHTPPNQTKTKPNHKCPIRIKYPSVIETVQKLQLIESPYIFV